MVCLMAPVMLIRWPFQVVSWALGLILEALAGLCAWCETW